MPISFYFGEIMSKDGYKIYLRPRSTVLNTIHDIIELQKARITYSDTPRGKISFTTKMYANKWEHRFTVTDIDKQRCGVHIEMGKETTGSGEQIKREFALLDSMLNENVQFETGMKRETPGDKQ